MCTAEVSGQLFEDLLADARHSALLKALSLGPHSLHTPPPDHSVLPRKTLVFANSVMSAEAAQVFLDDAAPEVATAVLHKRVPLAEREEVTVEFTSPDGEVDLLVATDMASRGLDTVEVGHVIQFECAVDVGSFLHRIGRTARAGGIGVGTSNAHSHAVCSTPADVDITLCAVA